MVAFSSFITLLVGIAGSLAAPLTEERSLGDELNLIRRAAINYYQNYTTGGQVGFSASGTGFQLNWNTNNDFVVGVGWTTGNTSPINFGGSFSVNSGTGLLAVYGWSTNPLVEYYVVESNRGFNPGGSVKGSVTSDGSSYTIWEHQQVNQPSIIGTATFNQYISIRNSQRTQGTVSIANHFNAWSSLGMNLGQMNYQVIAVEGWGGSGSASLAVNKN